MIVTLCASSPWARQASGSLMDPGLTWSVSHSLHADEHRRFARAFSYPSLRRESSPLPDTAYRWRSPLADDARSCGARSSHPATASLETCQGRICYMAAERRKTLGLASPTLLTPNTNLYHNYKTQSVRVADHTPCALASGRRQVRRRSSSAGTPQGIEEAKPLDPVVRENRRF